MNRREFLTLGSCAVALRAMSDAVPEVDMTGLTVSDFDQALALLTATGPEDAEKRAAALATAQKFIYAMRTGAPYEEFSRAGMKLSESAVKSVHERYPVLRWYDEAFDRVCREVETTVIDGDRPAIWYVYNMGIVVKTKTSTFAIDLCHRQATRLIPLLDFAFVSHNHQDHYLPDFIEGMQKAKKPLYTNFCLSWDYYTAQDREVEIKGVKVRITRGDHNAHLPLAVNCHEVDCGGEKPFVFFHSGDCYNPSQFRPSKPIDLFMGHCAIGLSFPKAHATTMPAKTMCTLHHQELGHLGGRWRCVGFHEEPAKILSEFKAQGVKAIMPVWGDRLV